MPLTRFCPGTFLSTLSLRRATSADYNCRNGRPDFYPRSPCGERRNRQPIFFWQAEFLSTLSLRRATHQANPRQNQRQFLSTLSLRRATKKEQKNIACSVISIHALLAESDDGTLNNNNAYNGFLSTLSLRRATLHHVVSVHTFFISIHALLAESDTRKCAAYGRRSNFYPRSPCGERRSRPRQGPDLPGISIHALLAESDVTTPAGAGSARDFYPRSPCGERLMDALVFANAMLFLSTLSLRRATREPTALRTPHHKFLSTLSLRRATQLSRGWRTYSRNFYPRSPCGERLRKVRAKSIDNIFLSTLSLRRATREERLRANLSQISIHALLAESDIRITLRM